MSDQSAVVWTRATGTPRRLGLVVRVERSVRFTYDREAGDLPGLSVTHDTSKLAGRTVSFPIIEANPLPPMLQALVPPREVNNLQRRVLTAVLGKETKLDGLPLEDVEWLMLLRAGRDSIGHLDVFADDEQARRWYEHPIPSIELSGIDNRPLWRLVAAASSPLADAATIEQIIEVLKVHPSPGGAMPKLLARLRRGGGTVDAVVKLSSPEYPHVLALETLAYEYHERVGIAVPGREFMVTGDGIEVLAVERFDRRDGLPLPLESIFCALFCATNNSANRIEQRWSAQSDTPSFKTIARLLQSPHAHATLDPRADCAEVFKRQVMALLTGNGDNHLENSAILGARAQARLSPLYDPAPMRGYFDKQMVSCVAFGGLVFRGGNVPSEIGEATLRLGREMGLSRRRTVAIVNECLDATADYAGAVARRVPDDLATKLTGRVESVRIRIVREVSGVAAAGGPEHPVEEDEASTTIEPS